MLTHAAELTLGGRSIEELSSGAIHPPLVSFVVICWNYDKYVADTLKSIKAQDYPHFECLVIDNGSTDNSFEVMTQACGDDPRFRIERLDRNMGQLGAAFWALNKISGRFVVFVDADDVLFTNYASVHLQVHLALPRSVAFTSSSAVQIDSAGRPLTSRYQHVNVDREHIAKGLRPAEYVLRFSTISDEDYKRLNSVTGIVPRSMAHWCWGPGTSNMYRKSILDLVTMSDGTESHRRSADGHYVRMCHAIAASALIDRAISGYRIHNNNYFATAELIQGVRSGTREYREKSLANRKISAELFLVKPEQFAWLLGPHYWKAVDQCMDDEDAGLRQFYKSETAVDLFKRHAKELRRSLGDKPFSREIVNRLGPKRASSVIRDSFDGNVPLRLTARLWLARLARLFPRPLRLKKKKSK